MELSKNYYFVGTYLPELQLGQKPDINFFEYDQLLQLNLSKQDYAKTRALRLLIDLENLRLFWEGRALDPRGTLDPAGFEEALLEGGHFPLWLDAYLEEYMQSRERLQHFSKLLAIFFQEEAPGHEGFLRDYFKWEKEARLILAALRSKKENKSLLKELEFEDPSEPFIQDMLTQKDTESYTAPSEYADLEKLFKTHSDDPEALSQALLEYRFAKIEELSGFEVFSLDRLLAYMAALFLVEKSEEQKKWSPKEKSNKMRSILEESVLWQH